MEWGYEKGKFLNRGWTEWTSWKKQGDKEYRMRFFIDDNIFATERLIEIEQKTITNETDNKNRR